ncbi:MAG: hypothetical protein IKJ14_00245 [Clostridia bacterium]|nr:hypothetical protein [Clostridia bacterium]
MKRIICAEELEQFLKKWLMDQVIKFDQNDAYVVKLNKYSKTMQLMRNFSNSSKKFLCLKNAFAIKYEYLQNTYAVFWNETNIEKRVCWIDLIVVRDNDPRRSEEVGITMSELKQYSRYYLNHIKNEAYCYLGKIYEQLKDVEKEFIKTMKEDKDFATFNVAFENPVEVRAQRYKNVQYGTTEDYLIVGARINACKAPEREIIIPNFSWGD